MLDTNGLSSSPSWAAYRCVDRGCPITWHARRPDTANAVCAWSTASPRPPAPPLRVLTPPARGGRLYALQLRAHLGDRLAFGQHPIRLPELADDLLRAVSPPLHHEPPCPGSGPERLFRRIDPG